MVFLLKAHRRQVYGDKVQTDITSNGEAVQTVLYIPDNGRDGPHDPATARPATGPARDLP